MALNPYLKAALGKVLFSPRSVYEVARGTGICAYWSKGAETRLNFGDALNPPLIRLLTGRVAVHLSDMPLGIRPRTLYLIGSILDGLKDRKALIAGAGFKKKSSRLKVHPSLVVAVRGPLSRQNMLASGVECPEIYCDPGLLLPKLCSFERRRGGRVGVIPHYVDKELVRKWPLNEDRYNVIDIEADIASVAREIASSEAVISSSLHGIIAAHSYGVPAAWMQLSNRVVGDGFKFYDYFASVNMNSVQPVEIGLLGEGLGRIKNSQVPDVYKLTDSFLPAFENSILDQWS